MSDTKRALSLRQRNTLDAVKAHYADHGRPPSYKELAARLGVVTSAASDLVKACARLGYLKAVRTRGVRTQVRLLTPLEESSTKDLLAELVQRNAAWVGVDLANGVALTGTIEVAAPVNDTADADRRIAA